MRGEKKKWREGVSASSVAGDGGQGRPVYRESSPSLRAQMSPMGHLEPTSCCAAPHFVYKTAAKLKISKLSMGGAGWRWQLTPGPALEGRGDQDGPKTVQKGLRPAQEAGNLPQDVPRQPQILPKRPQDSFNGLILAKQSFLKNTAKYSTPCLGHPKFRQHMD